MKRYLHFWILALVLLLLFAVPASAEIGVGSSPYVARIISPGLNIGQLPPGESFWYSFSAGDLGRGPSQSVILDLVFQPGDLRTASNVKFDIYTFDQVSGMIENGKPIAREGSGQLTTSDYDANTSERLWAGPVAPNEIYYIYLENQAKIAVDYHLNVLPQQHALATLLPKLETVNEDTDTVEDVATEPVLPDVSAQTIVSEDISAEWVLAVQAIQKMSEKEGAAWLKQAVEVGWLPTVNQSQAVAPREQTPPVVPQPAPAASTSDEEIETAQAVSIPVPPEDPNIYPTEPLILRYRNVGRLAPNAEHWFTFLRDDLDTDRFEEMKLTLFHTPGEGNIANRVNFELFTGDQYPIWMRGTPEDMVNFGAGGQVSRDGDDNTGERIWRGTIVDGDQYFVRVRNDSSVWIDYYLITDDIINTELGDAPNIHRGVPPSITAARPGERASIPVDVPPGTDIANPMTAKVGHNQGRVQAGEDRWYVFRFQNFVQEEPEFRRYSMTLKHTPGLGHIANHVNMEIYAHPQLALWLRGDGDLMTPLGVGSRQAYDKRTNTQQFIWDGHLVSDAFYFVRVRNGSGESIFFDLDIHRK